MEEEKRSKNYENLYRGGAKMRGVFVCGVNNFHMRGK
jgi:hypothetical protein